MYLKSLVLKGFKSFADRSALSLEPGVICIVGPNGSGKSNISDAILWVLGERSPKNLRGTAMEDVIFSGSKGRKPVNVAEVTLVLDNSDGQIPLEFTEIELTRRMYRTGGSDYFINGNAARLLDFLDILHDTGLGSGTHSIISQGNLEGILQSRPEDRRALIEEAAGILKHKQHKEQSARKLAVMDQHLVRVRDIFGEVQRQMGPLERKAKRALTYKELTQDYAQWRLRLAVDDLRVLQRKWDAVEEARTKNEALAEELKAQLAEAETALDELSRQMEAESRNREALLKSRARVLSLSAQLDACRGLLAQQESAARTRIAEEAFAEESLAAELVRLRADVERLEASRAKAEADVAEAEAARAEVARAQTDAQRRVQEAQMLCAQLQSARRKAQDELTSLQKCLAVARTDFDSDEHHLAFVQERIAEGTRTRLDLEHRREDARAELAASAQACTACETEDKAAALRLEQLAAQATEIEALRAERTSVVTSLEAELKALAEIERASKAAAGGAAAWLASEASPLHAVCAELASEIIVDPGFHRAVECALGQAVSGLAVVGEADLAAACEALLAQGLSGNAILARAGKPAADAAAWVAGEGGEGVGATAGEGAATSAAASTGAPTGTPAGVPAPFEPLLSHVRASSKAAAIVRSLLGDVILAPTVRAALEVAPAAPQGMRFVTREGQVVTASGVVSITGDADDMGVLARRRRSQECALELEDARAQLAATLERKDLIAAAQEEARLSAADATRLLAVAQGRYRAAQLALDDAETKFAAAQADLAGYEELATALVDKRNQAEPLIASLVLQVDAATHTIEDSATRLAAAETSLTEARAHITSSTELLSGRLAALNAAQSALALAKSRIMDRTTALKTTAARLDASRILRGKKTIARERLTQTLATVERLAAMLTTLPVAAYLPADAGAAGADGAGEGAPTALADRANAARLAVRDLRAQLDDTTSRTADNRVESAQLKMHVQNALDVITNECKTSLEAALATPALEDRAEAERLADTLRRRIANLGTVNPEAADEYLVVKRRFDFLRAQLTDLEQARAALTKIDAAIDNRMRTAFLDTFTQVNTNFQEVFGVLFPGGSAELVLSDPEDLAATGVDVIAQPQGKRITRMMLMSGGEKSLVALALLFAVYRTRTTPFYVLDEVEAALDDTNLRRLLAYLEQLRHTTQLIMITHQRRTMEMADLLFGVSMQNDGVTKVISQRLERALAYAEE